MQITVGRGKLKFWLNNEMDEYATSQGLPKIFANYCADKIVSNTTKL